MATVGWAWMFSTISSTFDQPSDYLPRPDKSSASRHQFIQPARRIFSRSLTTNVVFITERATGSRRTSRIDRMRRWIRSQGCCHVRSVIAASGALAEADAVGAAVASALELAERSSDVASLRGSDALAGPSP